jgi:hypothetical protein
MNSGGLTQTACGNETPSLLPHNSQIESLAGTRTRQSARC